MIEYETAPAPVDFSQYSELIAELMPGEDDPIAAIEETYDPEIDTVRIARVEGVVVAIARYKPNPVDADTTVLAHLWDIAVLPAYRRRGIARAMLTELFAECRSRGFRCIWSRTFTDNEAAIEFHRSLGFTVVFTKDDSIVWGRSVR
jgi:ribosomal protein S18 acetylase RimI-like enzyme